MRYLSKVLSLMVLVANFGGCSGDGRDAAKDSEGIEGSHGTTTGSIDLNSGASGGSVSGGNASVTSGGPQVGVEGRPGSCGSLQVSDGCVGEVFEGEAIPLDIHIIFDQSGSMATVVDEATGETRMDAVYRALEAFSSDSESIGLGVGVSFFGYQPIGNTSCDPDDYDSAAVKIAPLPANAGDFLAALKGVAPTGETPTAAAIEGGCRIAAAHRAENPGRKVVNLLVTDGEPKAPVTSKSMPCSPTLPEAVAASASCYEDGEGIPTYVLGVGSSLDNLNQIASAGGTSHAYLVQDDKSSGVLEALNQVRASAQIPCELGIDKSQPNLHYEQTSVVTLASDCTLSYLTKVSSAADCAGAGFHFDDPTSPSSILLCPESCAAVKEPLTKLLFSIGCGIEQVK